MAGLAESPENPSEPPHFKPRHKWERGAGVRLALLASTNPRNVFRMASESMAEFSAALLLLQDNHRLVEIRIALLDLVAQDSNLRVLATQAEDCSSRDVGMVDVSRNQPAQIVGVFTGAAAPAFMQQELDAVDVLKHAGALRLGAISGGAASPRGIQFAFPIELRQFGHLPAIDLRRRKTQLFFKGLLQNADVSVLTKDQRNHQPVVARAHLAIGPGIACERPLLPARNIRRLPVVLADCSWKSEAWC